VVSDVKNLTITSEGPEMPEILAAPRYANVISFRNCSGIRIENARFGHSPNTGYCEGGVLQFWNAGASS